VNAKKWEPLREWTMQVKLQPCNFEESPCKPCNLENNLFFGTIVFTCKVATTKKTLMQISDGSI
jgi:hypothetical protein